MDDDLIVSGNFTTDTGYDCTIQLLTLDSPPTAIFASNDQSAIGVFQATKELGLRIPEDLSVVGFDNISEAEHLGLTTVDQFLGNMGYLAVQLLIKLINNVPFEEQVYKIRTKLIIRSSCQALDRII